MSKHEDIIQIINRYLNNKYSKQDIIDIVKYLATENDITLFEKRLDYIWEDIAKQEKDISVHQEEILMAEADEILKRAKRRASRVKRISLLSVGKVAATICALIFITYFLFVGIQKSSAPKMETLVSACGEKKEFILSDKSSVYINAATILKYPEKFADNERLVELNGEAFFDITPNKKCPFVINASKISVKVLGTSFNIKNYDDDEWLAVTVASGTVLVTILNENTTVELNPLEELWINKKECSFTKRKKDSHRASLWMNGYLYFDKSPINDVINTLSRHYNVDIELAAETNTNYVISGEHDNKSLTSILESISFITGLKFRKESNKIILY